MTASRPSASISWIRMNAQIRTLADNPELNNILYLIKNGIPFDVAFSLPEAELTAYAIIFGRLDGGKWNWDRMAWETD